MNQMNELCAMDVADVTRIRLVDGLPNERGRFQSQGLRRNGGTLWRDSTPNQDIGAEVGPIWPHGRPWFDCNLSKGDSVFANGLEHRAHQQIRDIALDDRPICQREPKTKAFLRQDFTNPEQHSESPRITQAGQSVPACGHCVPFVAAKDTLFMVRNPIACLKKF